MLHVSQLLQGVEIWRILEMTNPGSTGKNWKSHLKIWEAWGKFSEALEEYWET